MALGPSHFVEPYNVSYDSISLFSVKSIRVRRQKSVITGSDNNKLRPVSNHLVGIAETVDIEFDDISAAKSLLTVTGAHDLTFNWLAAEQQITTSALITQLVTIKGVVFTSESMDAISKGIGTATISGMVLEVADDTDPIVFANGS